MSVRIAAGRATATIDPLRGGRLSSLTVDGVELLAAAEPIGAGPADWFDGSFPMAPYPGNVRGGAFLFEGQTHRLVPNNGPHAAHGLVDAVPWTCLSATERSVRLRTDIGAGWPFGGFAGQSFEIGEGHLEVTLTCSNDERAMPAALGFHPWFRRDLGEGPGTLQFEPGQRFQPVAPGLFGAPGSDLGERPWDNAFCGLAGTPGISWPGGQRIAVVSEAPVWMLYEQHPDGICIEPLTAAPAALAPGRAAIVRPGSPLSLTMRLEWA